MVSASYYRYYDKNMSEIKLKYEVESIGATSMCDWILFTYVVADHKKVADILVGPLSALKPFLVK